MLDRATPIHVAALEERALLTRVLCAEAREVPELEELAIAVDRRERATVRRAPYSAP